jgi:hypothetical protein
MVSSLVPPRAHSVVGSRVYCPRAHRHERSKQQAPCAQRHQKRFVQSFSWSKSHQTLAWSPKWNSPQHQCMVMKNNMLDMKDCKLASERMSLVAIAPQPDFAPANFYAVRLFSVTFFFLLAILLLLMIEVSKFPMIQISTLVLQNHPLS